MKTMEMDGWGRWQCNRRSRSRGVRRYAKTAVLGAPIFSPKVVARARYALCHSVASRVMDSEVLCAIHEEGRPD